MKKLYVGWQDQGTREWIPVAKLERTDAGYKLSYTAGAQRCQGFTGFGRMTKLDATYFSRDLFPFFENRLIKKSRPEYNKYLSWVGIENLDPDPLNILHVTGGIRSTDNLELFSEPLYENNKLVLNFFPRGLRYIYSKALDDINKLTRGTSLFIMHDLQNKIDKGALILRTEDPKINIGYIQRYYNNGLRKALDLGVTVRVFVLRVNQDAPADMRVLCRLEIEAQPNQIDLLSMNDDFSEWNSDVLIASNEKRLNEIATSLNLDNFSG